METLLVTAFFDIGRGESNIKNLKRSSQKYFDYFKHWARIQNLLVIYTQPEFVNEVMRIREEFGLKEKTIIITIEDLATIEPQIYKRMIEVEERGDWSYLRFTHRCSFKSGNVRLYYADKILVYVQRCYPSIF